MRRSIRAAVRLLAIAAALGADPAAAGSVPSAASHDVNGDGLADVLVPGAEVQGRYGYVFTRSAVVVLGSSAATPVDRRAIGDRGFTIVAGGEMDAPEMAGDVDGDGLADVVVEVRSGPRLVFGKRDLTTVDLRRADPGHRPLPGDEVEPVGDIDGDGLADLLVQTTQDRPPFRSRYAVVRGARERTMIADVTAGIAMRLSVPRGFEGGLTAAGPAGDMNRDGTGDLVMAFGNYYYCGEGGDGCGTRGFVVFGGPEARTVRIEGTYRRGFRVRQASGHAGFDMQPLLGYDGVPSAGDVDGDGRDDLIAGGFYSPTWLMYGKSGSPTLRARAPHATRYRHEPYAGGVATGIGDLDGDRRSEVLLTIEPPAPRGSPERQALTVVFGGPRRAVIDLRPAGYVIELPARIEPARLRATGDINGDGLGDFLVSIGPLGGGFPQRTFVVFGKSDRTRQSLTALGGGGFEIR